MLFEDLTSKQWLEENAKLQQKKRELRKILKERGILQRKGANKYDNYKYFSEAQYKELFTELFSEVGLELNCSEVDYLPFDGTEKQANGRIVKLQFMLLDTETGFFETSVISGEGIDKGDKAGYKAYTGALKYYLANTFMVATGDDAEKETPSVKTSKTTYKKQTEKTEVIEYATDTEIKTFKQLCANRDLIPENVLKQTGWEKGRMTAEQYGRALIILKDIAEVEEE